VVLQCHSLFPDFTHQHSQPIPATTSACHYPVAYCGELITIESRSHTPAPSHAGRSAGVKCIVTITIKNCIIVVPSLSSTYIYHHSGISLISISVFGLLLCTYTYLCLPLAPLLPRRFVYLPSNSCSNKLWDSTYL